MVIRDLAAGLSISPDIKTYVGRSIFSFKDGIILKGLSISKGDKNFIIPKIAIKKDDDFISIKIRRVLLDLDLLKSLIAISADSSTSSTLSLKIKLFLRKSP